MAEDRFSSPVEFLHQEIPEELRNEFLCHYYHFYFAFGKTSYRKKLKYPFGRDEKLYITMRELTNDMPGFQQLEEDKLQLSATVCEGADNSIDTLISLDIFTGE